MVAQGSGILAVSERHDLGVTGTFARPVLLEDGWWLAWGNAGDLVRAPLYEDDGWWADEHGIIPVLDQTNLVDHGLVQCPDGSYLHVASSTIETHDDSSYAHWLDADLNLVDEMVIEEAEPGRVHNDPAVVCGQTFSGVAHTGPDPGDPSWFFSLQDGEVGAPQELEASPRVSGAALLEADDRLVLVGTWNYVGELQVNVYDADLALVEGPIQQPILDGDAGIWWPTGLVRIGSHFLVATMGKELDANWSADTGEVWLLVLDEEFQVVEKVLISDLEPPDGAMRPWLTLDGDRLLVTADRLVRAVLWEVSLDLDALCEVPGDTGVPGDSGGTAETDEPGDSGASGEPVCPEASTEDRVCGCQAGPVGSAWSLLGLLGLCWRRSRGPPSLHVSEEL